MTKVCGTFLFKWHKFLSDLNAQICVNVESSGNDAQIREALPQVADLFASDSGFASFEQTEKPSETTPFVYDCFVMTEPKLDALLSTFPLSNNLWLQCENRPEYRLINSDPVL
jgi:hypothetical protein